MKLYRESEPDKVVQTGATCDRCGQPATVVGGAGFNVVQWGEFAGVRQGAHRVYADLCRECVEKFLRWVDEGDGTGYYDEIQAGHHVDNRERLPRLEDAIVGELARDLGLSSDGVQRVQRFVRARGGR